MPFMQDSNRRKPNIYENEGEGDAILFAFFTLVEPVVMTGFFV